MIFFYIISDFWNNSGTDLLATAFSVLMLSGRNYWYPKMGETEKVASPKFVFFGGLKVEILKNLYKWKIRLFSIVY